MSADKTPFGPKPGSPTARAMGCTCPALEDIPESERPPLPVEGKAMAFLAPTCELHGAMYNRLREAAERGHNSVIMSGAGEVLDEGVEQFRVPDEKFVDAIIDQLKACGLRPSLLTASACMSVGTSLAVAFELDREKYMEVCAQLWESCVEEHARIVAARAAGASVAN